MWYKTTLNVALHQLIFILLQVFASWAGWYIFAVRLGLGHRGDFAQYSESNLADTRRLTADRVPSGVIGHSKLGLRSVF